MFLRISMKLIDEFSFFDYLQVDLKKQVKVFLPNWTDTVKYAAIGGLPS
jgi:hypothetical protein